MIFADCPYCDESIVTPIARAGAIEKLACPRCARTIFLHHSRWRPHVYTEDQVVVNKADKTIDIIDPEARAEFILDYEDGMAMMAAFETGQPDLRNLAADLAFLYGDPDVGEPIGILKQTSEQP